MWKQTGEYRGAVLAAYLRLSTDTLLASEARLANEILLDLSWSTDVKQSDLKLFLHYDFNGIGD